MNANRRTSTAQGTSDSAHGTAPSPRRFPRAKKALAIMLAATALATTPATSALAWDSNCTHRTLKDADAHGTWVAQDSIGAVSWSTEMNITVYDKCSHGHLRSDVTIYHANITQKGGHIKANMTHYQRTGSDSWYRLPTRTNQWGTSSHRFFRDTDGGHMDLVPTWRITKVKLYTYVIFNGVASGGKAHTCDMVLRTCS